MVVSSSNYTLKAVADVESKLKKQGLKLPSKASTPLSLGYRPEIDLTRELNAKEQNYFQGVIGVLRWICKLGRLDIIMAVLLLSR